MSTRRTHTRESGFSLVELMVVLALLGILAVLAVPSMRSFYWGWKLKESAQQVTIMIQKARLRAVSTRAPVTVTLTDPAPANSGDVTVVVAEPGVATSSMRDATLRLSKTIRNNILITWRDYNNAMGSDRILTLTFNADGSVTSSEGTLPPTYNRPPRIEIYDRSHIGIVAPAYLRISPRGSVTVGSLDMTVVGWDSGNGCYAMPVDGLGNPIGELRGGIKIATSEK